MISIIYAFDVRIKNYWEIINFWISIFFLPGGFKIFSSATDLIIALRIQNSYNGIIYSVYMWGSRFYAVPSSDHYAAWRRGRPPRRKGQLAIPQDNIYIRAPAARRLPPAARRPAGLYANFSCLLFRMKSPGYKGDAGLSGGNRRPQRWELGAGIGARSTHIIL